MPTLRPLDKPFLLPLNHSYKLVVGSTLDWQIQHKNVNMSTPFSSFWHWFVKVFWLPSYSLSPEPVHFVCSPLLTVLSVCAPTLPHSATSVSGGFLWWLWLLKCWSSRERWRLRELAGDRNSVWTPALAEEWRVDSNPLYRKGGEIWTPFNTPFNNCVDKLHELPSAGMSWHLDNEL